MSLGVAFSPSTGAWGFWGGAAVNCGPGAAAPSGAGCSCLALIETAWGGLASGTTPPPKQDIPCPSPLSLTPARSCPVQKLDAFTRTQVRSGPSHLGGDTCGAAAFFQSSVCWRALPRGRNTKKRKMSTWLRTALAHHVQYSQFPDSGPNTGPWTGHFEIPAAPSPVFYPGSPGFPAFPRLLSFPCPPGLAPVSSPRSTKAGLASPR